MQDRVAKVTGAGRGIGRSAAKLLAERGARAMAVARTEASCGCSPPSSQGSRFWQRRCTHRRPAPR